MKKLGRFLVAFTIFALYTSFSPSDGTVENPAVASNEAVKVENVA